MKKMSFLLLSVCLAMLATSCKEEQTVLSLEELPYSTTITGKLVYDAGFVKVDEGRYERQSEAPAVGRKVVAVVDYSQYGGGNVGSKMYEAVTDADGVYAFTIKTMTSGIEVEVNPEAFDAQVGELKEVDGKQELVMKNYNFKVNNPIKFQKSETRPNMTTVKDQPTTYQGTETDEPAAYPYHIKVKGMVKIPVEDEKTGAQSYVGQAGLQVKAYYNVNSGSGMDDAVMVVEGVTSGMQGEYTVELPVADLSETYTVTVKALAFRGEYTEYSGGKSEVLNGIYSPSSGYTASGTFNPNGFDGRTLELNEIRMEFTADDN